MRKWWWRSQRRWALPALTVCHCRRTHIDAGCLCDNEVKWWLTWWVVYVCLSNCRMDWPMSMLGLVWADHRKIAPSISWMEFISTSGTFTATWCAVNASLCNYSFVWCGVCPHRGNDALFDLIVQCINKHLPYWRPADLDIDLPPWQQAAKEDVVPAWMDSLFILPYILIGGRQYRVVGDILYLLDRSQ